MPTKLMLDDLELPLVQQLDAAEHQERAQHAIPSLEGDFIQPLGRRATAFTLQGVIANQEGTVAEQLKDLREKFRAAAPVDFVADIATATRVDTVLIEEMSVRELAGKPNRFEYAFALREYIPAPTQPTEPAPPPPQPLQTSLIVEVLVRGHPGYDFSQIEVSVKGTQEDGISVDRPLTNRMNNVWTEETFQPGSFTVRATGADPVVPHTVMVKEERAEILEGEKEKVTIELEPGKRRNVAIAYVIHYWFDTGFIEPCMRPMLREVAQYAASHDQEKLLIVGHTDKVGSDQYNQALSERRARGVYAYLTFKNDENAAVAEWNELRKARTTGDTNSLNDTWSAREYQYMLQDLGYYIGPINEQHDDNTDAAVRAFQREKGIAENGVVDDTTWPLLIRDYLAQDSLSVDDRHFFRNAGDGCDGGLLLWVGCGEKDPVDNRNTAWRPNRRTEMLFVNADEIPCKIPQPGTWAIRPGDPEGSPVPPWCLGPGEKNKPCCFLSRAAEAPNKWLVQPAHPEKVKVNGRITYEDGTPYANQRYALIAADGEYLHKKIKPDGTEEVDLGEIPSGNDRGRPIYMRTDADGNFSHPKDTLVGTYILELPDLLAPQVAREASAPPLTGRGNIVCKQIDAQATSSTGTFAPPSTALGLPALVMAIPAAGGNIARPEIVLASPVVVVKRSYTNPARQLVTLRANNQLFNNGVFTASDATKIRFFTTAVGGTALTFNGTDNTFTNQQLTSANGVQLFAEGVSASTAMDDVTLKLTLSPATLPPGTAGPPLPPPGGPTTATMTAVQLRLNIFMSRTANATDPAPLPQPPAPAPAPGTATDKWFGGRFIHVQDPGNQHGRALLVVTQQPAAFNGKLTLGNVAVSAAHVITGADGRADLFTPEFGGAALAHPFEFTPPAAGQRFWVQGKAVSGTLRDTGFQLGIKGLEPDGDRVRLTVVRLSNLQALIPSTPPALARMANGPVPNSRFRTATGAAPAAADFSHDFIVNRPLVLIQGALPAASRVQLSVNVAPAGVPVSWSVVRDTRPAPNGDHPAVVALSPNPIPSVVRNAGNFLQATLQDNAVGSFHIHPYIDSNNDNTFNTTRNKEPFLTMNLVLIRVGGSVGATHSTNTSVAHPGNIAPVPAIGAASSATGVQFRSGNFVGPVTAGVQNVATAVVVGGGRNGRLGLDHLFGGWVNNLTGMTIQATYRDLGPGVNHLRTAIAVSDIPNPNVFVPAGTVGAPPGSTTAPTILPLPVLDTTNFGSEGTGGNTAVGTEGAIGPPPPPAAGAHRGITRTNLAVGQTYRIQMWDSPGFPAPAAHGLHPGRLTSFQYEVDFQCDLCFWTNSNVPGVRGPTPGPITGAVPPVPDAACTSYATVQTNNWAIRWRMNFAIPGGPPPLPPTIGTVPVSSITMTRDASPLRLARPAQGVLEVRFPIILNVVALDLRT